VAALAAAPALVGWTAGAPAGGARRAPDAGAHQASLAAPAVDVVATPDGAGVWVGTGDGGVLTMGDAAYLGSMGGQALNAPMVGMAATHDGKGYWLVAADGGVFSFGDAAFHGSTGGARLNRPIVGVAATPDGGGYRFVASDGGVFSFGDAAFHGSTGGARLNQPIVGLADDPATGGYWLVAADGGVFAFDAPFLGSTGDIRLNRPIFGMAATPDGRGYWLVAADGGIFAFGDATFEGAGTGGFAAAMAATPDGGGYWVVDPQATVAGFGDARRFAPLAVSAGAYGFEQTNADGSPSRWNPCQAIPYVVDASEAPAGALAMVQSGLEAVSEATGLQFSYQGPSAEFASRQRPLTTDGHWSPVLIAWQRPDQGDYLPSSGENGMGGFTAVTGPQGGWVDVTGQVALNVAAPQTSDFAQSGGWTHLILHELGHLVGLAHVQDSSQVMYPVAVPGSATSYGSGDMAGLAQLGSQAGCLAEPSPAGF